METISLDEHRRQLDEHRRQYRLANGMAALRACRGALDGLPLKERGSVCSTLMAEFLACWPEQSRGEMQRIMTTQTDIILEIIVSPPPDDAA